MTESSAADQKRFIDANTLQALSQRLAGKIFTADFVPTFIIALWRGGCAPAAVVQEALQYLQGTAIDHVATRTESRESGTGKAKEIYVHAMGHAYATLTPESRLLIVDDVWDRGRTIQAVLENLRTHLGDRMPHEVRVATVFYKPLRNLVKAVPDFFVEETDDWLVFPHEMAELSEKEVAQHHSYLYKLKHGE
jgi:hypoxanthine phosphoribosyltransferase